MRDGLAAGRVRALSVDIFDTLVWRRVPEPADAFLLLGQSLKDSGKLAAHLSPIQFAELRRTAERAAREKAEAATGYREITLKDVYAGLPDHLFVPGFTQDQRIAAELAREESLLLLDEDLASLVRAAKAAGAKVVFVSDTYFTAAEVRRLLAAAGFKDMELVDRLYVSCEAGRPKYRDLFDTVVKDLGVPGEAIVHVGDNMDADVHPCRQRGITCVHYDKWAFAPRVQGQEFGAEVAPRAHLLGARGDFGLTGLRTRLFHRAPASLPAELRFFWGYGAAILAPVFAGFARWVVAQARGGTICGLMREGRFLNQVVAATAADLNAALITKGIWLSRRAAIRAALYDDDLSLLTEAVALSPGHSTDECLVSLGLVRADLAGALPSGFDVRQADALGQLSRAIAATPRLREKVVVHSARLRRNLVSGLARRMDLTGAVTVMDLGYAATIQSVLGRILARENKGTRLSGLYLALNEKALINTARGADVRAFLGDDGYHGLTGALLSRTPDVLEHACMCREGSLKEYDEAGQPVLLPNQRDERQHREMEAMQAGILAGVRAVNALLGDLAATPADQPELKAQIERIIQAALLHPTAREAEAIGAWHHEANFDLSDLRRLRDLAFDTQALQYQGWPALWGIGRHQSYWPAAALAAVSPFMGKMYAAGARGSATADHLTSGPVLGALTICPDLGVGFDKKREGAVPLAVNAFGRAEISVTVKPPGPEAFRRLRLRFPNARAVVSLDQFAAAFAGEREHRTVGLLDAGGRRLAWSKAEIGAGGIVTTAAEGSELVVDLAGDVPPWAHALSLRLRLKYLRLDDLFR